MILAAVVKGIDFELVQSEVGVDECADVTLGPKGGLWMLPKHREGKKPAAAATSRL
jgi:hypothetical protein